MISDENSKPFYNYLTNVKNSQECFLWSEGKAKLIDGSPFFPKVFNSYISGNVDAIYTTYNVINVKQVMEHTLKKEQREKVVFRIFLSYQVFVLYSRHNNFEISLEEPE